MQRELATGMLALFGVRPDTASSAMEAKSLLKNKTYQFVVTDCEMETPDAGIELARLAVRSGVKVVVLSTGRDLDDIREKVDKQVSIKGKMRYKDWKDLMEGFNIRRENN
jgi:DNA-binding NtrC family response regulator